MTRQLGEIWVYLSATPLLGLAFGKLLKAQLFNAPTVATTFVLGAFVKDKYAEIKTVVSEQGRSFLEAEEKVLGEDGKILDFENW